MDKYLFIMLIISVCIGQDEWIYYNDYPRVFRTKPNGSETELFLQGAFLQDISENQDKFLFTTDNNAFAGNNNIYYLNDNTLDSLVLTQGCYYARFTQSENEIIYHKPTLGQGSLDKIYSYSFDSDTTRLLADSVSRFLNMYGIMSPHKDRFAYFKSDFNYSGSYEFFVVDIQSGQETFLTTIQMINNIWDPSHSVWATDNYIYLNIADSSGAQLYKIHSSDTDIPIEQLTEEPAYLKLLGTYDNDLDKLLLASGSNLWVYEFDLGQLSFIDSVEGPISRQAWSMDKSKVAFGGRRSIWSSSSSPTIKVYDFLNDTIVALSDTAEPLFWLGGQDLGIKNNPDVMPSNFFLSQNFPNPFNPVTTLEYDLLEDGPVNIKIYDILGNVVNNLINANQSSGYKSIQWDATNNQGEPVSAGVYLYQIQAGGFVDTKKMILLK